MAIMDGDGNVVKMYGYQWVKDDDSTTNPK